MNTAQVQALSDALKTIRNARDYHSEHGHYPKKGPKDDQCFDDWAADIADNALKLAKVQA